MIKDKLYHTPQRTARSPRKKKARRCNGYHNGPRIPKDIKIEQLVGTLI